MKGTTWVFLFAFAALIFFKFQMGRRSPEELTVMRQAVADGGLLLDVRSPGEFSSGHIDGALNIPVGDLQSRLKELDDKDRAVVVYCASGVRSKSAASLLREHGFKDVHDLGSLSNW